ncbi:hypothetical protein F5Y19DRAFT_467671 [Xylariaceae sp. FL1651]|nr:hypothetical protein F5Y19DRAFT_467671 [Xylariaceae sp. FL1651]
MTASFLHSQGKIVVLLALLLSVLSSFTSASSPPAVSPTAETDLICHTDNPAECYPKVFSATEEFQVVHDDQDLPPGLHVQLDVQTGQKQAKLYDPNEEHPELAGLPVNQEVIVVDPDSSQDSPKIPAGAPAYEPIGKVKAPQDKNEEFPQALQTIKKSSERRKSVDISALDGALQLLDDLAHDMYYGVQIAEDSEAVQTLFCLLLKGEISQAQDQPLTDRADFLASSILSSVVRNNAPALAAIEKSWESIMEKPCNSPSQSIKHELFHRLTPISGTDTELEYQEADTIRFCLSVISGLMKSPKFRTEFLDNSGMQSFLQILLREGEVWEPRKAKIAQIISDTFLDEDLGATLGIWPGEQVDASHCVEGGSKSLGDECWEHHLQQVNQRAGAPEWSEQLLSLLRRTQDPTSLSKNPPKHSEL